MSVRSRLGLHIALFVATALSTMAVGAIQKGYDPWFDLVRLLAGWEFSLTLMSILLIHEMGHFVVWLAGPEAPAHGPRFVAELRRIGEQGEAWAIEEAARFESGPRISA